MRLQLDTVSANSSSEITGAAASGVGSTSNIDERFQTYKGGIGSESNLNNDSVAFSGASQAWSASFTDRAARIGQLTAAIHNGTYHVSSGAISESILASATA